MALTLPYPSMNFVPLDVLTAAEQNQLVANIEYIATQFPVTTANIANGAVTSDKLNPTVTDVTVGFMDSTSTVTGSVTGKLIRIGGGLGILSFGGSTGIVTAAQGAVQCIVNYGMTFSTVYSAVFDSRFTGMVDAYLSYVDYYGAAADTWTQKPTAGSQTLYLTATIIGVIA